jgi:hypothetical protein
MKHTHKKRKLTTLISIPYNIKLITETDCDNLPFQDT